MWVTRTEVGSILDVEGRVVCAACQCARGDLLLVRPETEADGDLLAQQDFVEL